MERADLGRWDYSLGGIQVGFLDMGRSRDSRISVSQEGLILGGFSEKVDLRVGFCG